jgi:hypothetical protein
MATPHAIGGKILAVDGEDLSGTSHLCSHDKRRIGEIHGMISILLHQLKGTLQLCLTHKPHTARESF